MTQPPIPEGETPTVEILRNALEAAKQELEQFIPVTNVKVLDQINKVLASTKQWQKAQAGGEWISVDTDLPENETEVNVLLGNNMVKIATFIINNSYKSFYCGQSKTMSYGNVTHWMPLPEMPTPR